MITTNCCQAQWTGSRTSHCTVCHETFTGLAAFDAHRRGSFTESGEKIIDKDTGQPRGPRRCIPPAEAGLIPAERKYPCWAKEYDE